MRLNETGARRMLLAAQGLLHRRRRKPTKADVLDSIRQMGALQIDTINVVARSPYLVLWSRLGGAYDPAWLNQHLAEGALFEYWSHAACFLPIDDYPLYRPFMRTERRRALAWLKENQAVASEVLAFVRTTGEARSSDFKRTGLSAGGWWSWKPEKLALECLHSTGELMIARRDQGFQRVYVTRERILSKLDLMPQLSLEEAQRALLIQSVRALGVAKAAWTSDYFRLAKRGVEAALASLSDSGDLIRVDVEGWDQPGYIHPANLETARTAESGALKPTVTTLLSPFDPVVWDRKRLHDMFNFHYRIEVYTPQQKRRFGYFSLPILHCDHLVGRLDAKAHRAEGRFEVREIHLESGVRVSGRLISGLGEAIRDCALWHRTPDVDILHSDPPHLAGELSRQLST